MKARDPIVVDISIAVAAAFKIVLDYSFGTTSLSVSFGFRVSGESWVDAGIPHVPMRLA